VTTPTDPPVVTTDAFAPFLNSTWNFSVEFSDQTVEASYLFDSEIFTHDDGRVSLGAVELPAEDIWVLLYEGNSETGLANYSLFTLDEEDNLVIYLFTCDTIYCDTTIRGTLEFYYADDTVSPAFPFVGTRALADEETPLDSELFSLGTAKAINTAGFTSSDTQFSGNLFVADMNPSPIQFISSQQSVGIKVSIQVDPSDVGKMADILFVVGLEPFSPNTSYTGDADTSYITVTAEGNSLPVDLYAAPDIWMPQLSEPYQSSVLLENQLTLDLGEWLFSSLGMRYLFVGYRLPDGTIIYTAQPLMVEVTG
jgi:hypothetical protein